VLLDEAYVDFAPSATYLPYLSQYPNLAILQTFSKAWGLAGLRLGMLFGNPQLIDWLNRIKPPYNINALTQKRASEALTQVAKYEQFVAQIIEQREALRQFLQQLGFVQTVFPSDANFLLVRVTDAPALYAYLVGRGIVVRNRSSELHCENCLRISIGTPEQNEILKGALQQFQN
jgi:histidinol-phosphate aminotransferase